jgi:hypothetical protein
MKRMRRMMMRSKASSHSFFHHDKSFESGEAKREASGKLCFSAKLDSGELS